MQAMDRVRKLKEHEERERHQLLRQINELTEKPLIVLSLVWVLLLILEFTIGQNQLLGRLALGIWALFVLDFLIEFTIAPQKKQYLKTNWLTALSLLLPALRVLRLFRALRLLRAARAARSVGLIRVITSMNRGIKTLRRLLGGKGIEYVLALTVLIALAGAAGMLYFENPQALRESGFEGDDAQGLSGYGDALWWTAMLLTTLGSEYWPQTAEGRILAFLLALYAFAVFGYVTATIASFFIAKDARRHIAD